MRRCSTFLAFFIAGTARAADAPAILALAAPKAAALTPQDIADGWINLFDGETTFGWKIDGDATVKDGLLILGGIKRTTATTSSEFATFKYRLKYSNSFRGEQSPKSHQGTNRPHPLEFGAVETSGDTGGPYRLDPISVGPLILEIP